MVKGRVKDVLCVVRENIFNVLKSPSRTFLVMALFSGLILVVAQPIYGTPDEMFHFMRAIQVSDGNLRGEVKAGVSGGEIPREIALSLGEASDFRGYIKVQSIGSELGRTVDMSDRVFMPFPQTVYYSPGAYVPQSVGIKIAEFVKPSLGVMFLLGRLFNLAVYILLVALAIRIAVVGRWVFVAVALFPISIQQASSLSPDAVLIGALILFLAAASRWILNKFTNYKQALVYLIPTVIVISTIKYVYLLLLPALLFRRAKNMKGHLLNLSLVAASVLVGLLMAGGWSIYRDSGGFIDHDYTNRGVNSAKQIQAIVDNPSVVPTVLVNTYALDISTHNTDLDNVKSVRTSPDKMLVSAYSAPLINYYATPLWLVFLGIIVFIITLLDAVYRLDINKKDIKRLEIAGYTLFITVITAISIGIYIEWNTVGEEYIRGLQGRYFTPLFPLLVSIGISARRYMEFRLKKEYAIGVLIATVVVLNILVSLTMMKNYFIY